MEPPAWPEPHRPPQATACPPTLRRPWACGRTPRAGPATTVPAAPSAPPGLSATIARTAHRVRRPGDPRSHRPPPSHITHPTPSTLLLSPGYFLASVAEPSAPAVLYSPEFQASGPHNCSVRRVGTEGCLSWCLGPGTVFPDHPRSLPSSSSITTCMGPRPAACSCSCRLRAPAPPRPLCCYAGATGIWGPPGSETGLTSRARSPSR